MTARGEVPPSFLILLFFAYAGGVGYRRRLELREIADTITGISNNRIAAVTLGQVCATGVVMLDVGAS